jgi:hypothetical protein
VHSLARELSGERARRRQETLLAGPARPWRVFRHGIDTVSYAWREFDQEAALQRLAAGVRVSESGELLRAKRKAANAWFTDEESGARAGVTKTPTGSALLWCEARLSALCANDATEHGLAAPEMLDDGAEAARAIAGRLGLAPRDGAATLLRRLDPAADVAFARAADGLAFLQAMAHLDCPGYKRHPTHAKGTSEVESVEWRTPKSFRIVHRCYDKGREAATTAPGRLVRLERQWWVPSSERTAPSALLGGDLASLFAGPLKGWVKPGQGVLAVGPYDACALLRERVGKPLGMSGRKLTLRVAERIAGTIGVLSVCGDGWFDNARTAQRRRAELRRVGIEFVSELPAGVRIDVGAVLVAACDAWA